MNSRGGEGVGEACSGWSWVEVRKGDGYFCPHLIDTVVTEHSSRSWCAPLPTPFPVQSPQFPPGLGFLPNPPRSHRKTHLQRQALHHHLHQSWSTALWGPGQPSQRRCSMGREVGMHVIQDQGDRLGETGDGKPLPARQEELGRLGKARPGLPGCLS